MATKPIIPTDAEIEIADRIGAGLAGLGADVAGLVPAKVQESLTYLNGLSAVVDSIRSEQPKLLEPYAEPIMNLLRKSAGLDVSQAADVLGALFSSVALARILGDVAAGNLDPVAVTKKVKSTTAKPAKKAVAAPIAAVPPVVETPVAVAPAVEAAAAAEPVAPVAAPVVAAPVTPVIPAVAVADDADDSIPGEELDPNDFDETPVVETPAPAKKATAKKTAVAKTAAPVPVASPSIGAGLLDEDGADDDF